MLCQEILYGMINGKLTGFIKINVNAVVGGEKCGKPLIIAVHNFTAEHKTGLSDRLVYENITLLKQYVFKVN